MNCTPNATISPQLGLALSPGPEIGASQDSGTGNSGSSGGGLWFTLLLGKTLMVMCVIGAAGNTYTLVITQSAALHQTGSMYVYIINLALADLLYLSTIPFVVCTYFAHDWLFGEAGCRILLSLDLLTMHASIFSLVAMSAERYRAVAKPFIVHRSSRNRKVVTSFIWRISLVLTLLMMIIIRLSESKSNMSGVVKRFAFQRGLRKLLKFTSRCCFLQVSYFLDWS